MTIADNEDATAPACAIWHTDAVISHVRYVTAAKSPRNRARWRMRRADQPTSDGIWSDVARDRVVKQRGWESHRLIEGP
jgi:hypothetical protein